MKICRILSIFLILALMTSIVSLAKETQKEQSNGTIQSDNIASENSTNDTGITNDGTKPSDFPINRTEILKNFTKNMENFTNRTLPANAIPSSYLSYTNPSSGISVFATQFSKYIYATGGQYWAEYSFYLPIASYVNVGMSGTVVSDLSANAYTNYVLAADGNQWGSGILNYPTYGWFRGGYMGIASTEMFYLNKGGHTIYLFGQSTPDHVCSNGNDCYSVFGSLSIIAIPEYTAITVTSPNGGENWAKGTYQTIIWKKDGNPGTNVKIELYKAGVLSSVVSSNTPDDGTHSWYIPTYQPIGTDYKIKITSTSDPTKYYDWSDNYFRIY